MKKRINMASFYNRMRRNTENMYNYVVRVDSTPIIFEEPTKEEVEQEVPKKKKGKNKKK